MSATRKSPKIIKEKPVGIKHTGLTGRKPLPSDVREKLDLYFTMTLSVWKSAMDALGLKEREYKKKEAIGWACTAAKIVAESSVEQGLTLAECLRRAAKILVDKANELKDV